MVRRPGDPDRSGRGSGSLRRRRLCRLLLSRGGRGGDDSFGAGRFVAIGTDGAQAILHLDARETGRVALGYIGCDDDALDRELPLLSANEEAYARVILAFLAELQKARLDQ